MGSQEPSERVAPKYLNSDIDDAVKLLKAGNTTLDPWQVSVLTDWLAHDNGRWICKTCAGSVPRQNGKTLLLEARAVIGMLLYSEQVIYTAHLQKTATETFEEIASFFEEEALKPYVKEIKTALGRELIVLKNGARIKFLARTRNGGRGQHGDLLIFDEAQELSVEAQASFIPAISASLNPQVVYVGTPPDPTADGTVFRGIRDKALNKETHTTAWFEFAAKEIGDVHDKTRWYETNPALGTRILEATIEGECEQMPADTFARERLGWWTPRPTEHIDYAIDKDLWEACKSKDPKPAGKTAYGVKFSADGSTVALAGAVVPATGPARISLIEYKSTSQGIRWLSEWLNQRYNQACCVVIDGRNGVDLLTDRISDTWRIKGSVIKPSARDAVAAADTLLNALKEKGVTWYYQQEVLNDSATTAIKRPIGAGFGFGGDNAAPVEAAALALWGVINSKRNPAKPMRIG